MADMVYIVRIFTDKGAEMTENLKELFVDMVDLDDEIVRVRNLGYQYLDQGHTDSFYVAGARESQLIQERCRRRETGCASV
jgi:hypothetical protein